MCSINRGCGTGASPSRDEEFDDAPSSPRNAATRQRNRVCVRCRCGVPSQRTSSAALCVSASTRTVFVGLPPTRDQTSLADPVMLIALEHVARAPAFTNLATPAGSVLSTGVPRLCTQTPDSPTVFVLKTLQPADRLGQHPITGAATRSRLPAPAVGRLRRERCFRCRRPHPLRRRAADRPRKHKTRSRRHPQAERSFT